MHSARFGGHAKWTPAENKRLVDLVGSSTDPNWAVIAPHFPGKTLHLVIDRWQKVLNPALVKGSWTRAEDEAIANWVRPQGAVNWSKLAEILPDAPGSSAGSAGTMA
jgi:hypothetical protein